MKPRRLSSVEQEQISVTIAALGQRGEGLALHDGRRVYIPGALAGETVRATLKEQVDRDVFRASLDELTALSPDRAQPPCVHYENCGGCALQHMRAEAYQGWKALQVRERLEKAGLKPEIWDEPVFIPQATRRRATFVVMKQNQHLLAGFHSRRSHQIVATDQCLIVEPGLLSLLERSKPWLLKLLKDGRPADLFLQIVNGQAEAVLTGPLATRDLDLEMREAFAGWAEALDLNRVGWRLKARDEAETMVQRRPVIARFGALAVHLPPGAFLQPSREGEAALTGTAMDMLKESGCKGRVADLFAGCGTFSGRLLECGPVHAVEFDPVAVEALNAAKGGHALTVEKRNLFAAPLAGKELQRFSAVLLDPPRAGAAEQVAELAKTKVPAVVYISCNPATFARDAGILRNGGYKLKRLRVIDQFIWSAHTELAALFMAG